MGRERFAPNSLTRFSETESQRRSRAEGRIRLQSAYPWKRLVSPFGESHYPLLVGPENGKAFSESSRYAQNLFPEKRGCFPFGITVPSETGKQSTLHTLCSEPPV
jgi:hypothetical protein